MPPFATTPVACPTDPIPGVAIVTGGQQHDDGIDGELLASEDRDVLHGLDRRALAEHCRRAQVGACTAPAADG